MQLQKIETKIYEIRGQKVMLDFDLAVKRNLKRFPKDFMFQLTKPEWESLRFNFSTSKPQRLQNETLETGRGKYTKYLPHAFTEQGLAMLSGVLNSDKAIDVNISIMRAFVFIRQYALTHKDLTDKLKKLERKYNKQFKDVYEAISYLLNKDKQETEQKERKRIGYK